MLKVAYITNAKADSGVGRRALEIKNRLKDVEVVDFYIDGEKGWFKTKTLNWIWQGWNLRKQLRRENFDVIHVTNQTMSFCVPNGLKSVVTVHDLIELIEPQQGLAGLAAKYLYSGIKKSDKIIAVSDFTKRTILEKLGNDGSKIAVVHNGVSDGFYEIADFRNTIGFKTLKQELMLSNSAQVMLFVGSDHSRKNAGVALEVFAKLRKKCPDLVFMKVGKPGILSGREEMLKKIDNLGVRDFVKIINDVSQERLNELYNLADVFIFTSKFEGFGLPPLEAMACGTPVVVSDATSIPEVVGDAALLNKPDDVDGLVRNVERVLSDANLREELRLKGITRAKEFSWDKAVEGVLAVYHSL